MNAMFVCIVVCLELHPTFGLTATQHRATVNTVGRPPHLYEVPETAASSFWTSPLTLFSWLQQYESKAIKLAVRSSENVHQGETLEVLPLQLKWRLLMATVLVMASALLERRTQDVWWICQHLMGRQFFRVLIPQMN
ncbi:hypothetical protein JOB18_001631 [Solea senegalensis]|uniref:Secreted protein n=1 Tax=Solea senegalensis TaxID=28829 RepID=A0AAV6R8J6_SOLSE|nr:hypothetical protein JOB18_001631 [Solea senegalensis]